MKWWERISRAWRLALILWLGMRLVYWAISAFLFYSRIMPLESPFPEAPVALNQGLAGALFGTWLRWDGGFYYLLVTQGYNATPDISAFFPLYPLLAKVLSWLGIHPLLALILVSNLAFLAALGIFLGEVQELFGSKMMLPAGLALLVFPGSFFFYAPFPQSLALLLILLSWKFCRQNRWLAASITGLLSGLTHSTVIPLCILLFYYSVNWIKSTTGKLRWLSLAVPATPILGTLLFIAWRQLQGYPSLVKIETQSWGMSAFDPVGGVIQLFQSLAEGNALSYLKLIILAISIFCIVWLLRNRLFPLGLYQVALIIFIISFSLPDHPFAGFIRYFMISFPVFISLVAIFWKKRYLFSGILSVLGVTNILLSVLYLSWFFVG